MTSCLAALRRYRGEGCTVSVFTFPGLALLHAAAAELGTQYCKHMQGRVVFSVTIENRSYHRSESLIQRNRTAYAGSVGL